VTGAVLARRYGRLKGVDRWSANSRLWWARAEREAPRELAAYRAVKRTRSKKAQRVALLRLKEALR
jgi:hypothetical protein